MGNPISIEYVKTEGQNTFATTALSGSAKAKKGYWIFTPEAADAAGKIHRVSSFTRLFFHTIVTSVKKLTHSRPLDALKVTAIVTVPMALHNIAGACKAMVGSTLNEKADAALIITSSFGMILDGVATATEGLAATGAFLAKAAPWTTPLFIVGISLQSFALILAIKELAETKMFARTFTQHAGLHKRDETYLLEDFLKGMRLIVKASAEEKSAVFKHFRTDDKKLIGRLEAIQAKAEKALESKDSQAIAESRLEMKNAMEHLGMRMKKVQDSRVLSSIAALVSIVGIIFLIAGPIAPVGFAFLALGAALSMYAIYRMNEDDRKFEEQMNLNSEGVA